MLSAPRSREHGAAAHELAGTSPERLQRSPSSMKLSQGEFRARWLRRAAVLFGLVVAALLLLRCATEVVRLFHWAEHHIDRESPTHMLLFFAVTLPFNLGVPVPLVHQAWAVAVGVFFRWRAYPILLAMLSVGVPLPFVIGRRLRNSRGGENALEARLRLWAPRATAYLNPLRRAIGLRPVRSCFLLMWAPLPTSTLPLLVGFLIPPSELSLADFVCGALPSKLLHFSADVLVGIEAGSLAAALDAHDDLPGVDDLDADVVSSRRRARRIAVGTMGLTVFFVAGMFHTMHSALKEMRAKEEGERLLGSPV